MSRIIDAASIVMTCDDEIFIIERQNYLNAFPGYWAFPGGKVEAEDADFSIKHALLEGIDEKIFGTVVREGIEELGIDIRQELLSGRIRSIDLLGLAVTPEFNPYRFSTYFFRIDFVQKVKFVIDENEARSAKWISSEDLLDTFNQGQILAVPPVIRVIETLGKNPMTKEIKNLNFTYNESLHVPYIESLKGIKQLMPLSNTLPPAHRTNAFIIGDTNTTRIIVDPSPRDENEYIKLKNTLELFGVDKIFLTHHHPDHHEYSNQLAIELNVPILLSQYTFDRIIKKIPGYFNGIDVIFVKDNDVITTWLSVDVLAMEIPGHDEGQLALYPNDLSWFIAGDLFQGIGTVVIGGEEGNMKKYFDTLEKVIRMSPKVIFPSHGIGLGGTYFLEKTLDHRRLRENQILELCSQGVAPKEILGRLYSEVDKKLWPYALENIYKHLEKLKEEGRI